MGTSLFNSKMETGESDKPRTTSHPTSDSRNQVQYFLTPSIGNIKEEESGVRAEFSLPSISLHMYEQQENSQNEASNFRANVAPKFKESENFQSHYHSKTNQSEQMKRTSRNMRPKLGRNHHNYKKGNADPNSMSKATVKGKTRLIGPMNKMDMIVEYSKLLQNRIINYDQYINKLSKLSLHKIVLGNSGLRHYHIIRWVFACSFVWFIHHLYLPGCVEPRFKIF